jgi:GDP-4-dehydro-6-deoxy-D-mannose reductase
MRILVTGAGGFVGKHLVQALLADGQNEVFANVYSKPGDLATLLPEGAILPADLTDYEATVNLIKTARPDLIYHLASLSVVHNSAADGGKILTNNVALQYNLLEAVRLYAREARVVVISSGNVYGNADPKYIPMNEATPLRPLNPYAVSKLNQEFLALQYHLAHALDIVILRPFNHTGTGQTTDFIVPMLGQQFVAIGRGQQAPTIQVGNTESKRDFTDVRDMCQAYLLAGKLGVAGEVYNLGTGIGVSVGDIIETYEGLTGTKVTVEIDQARVRSSDVPILVSDSTKFRALTGWSPKTPLRDTLKSVLEYWEEKT